MLIPNAVKKVEKYAPVKVNGSFFTAQIGNKVLEFTRNGHSNDVATINVRSVNDHSDVMTDYFAGSYFSTMSSALRFIEGR